LLLSFGRLLLLRPRGSASAVARILSKRHNISGSEPTTHELLLLNDGTAKRKSIVGCCWCWCCAACLLLRRRAATAIGIQWMILASSSNFPIFTTLYQSFYFFNFFHSFSLLQVEGAKNISRKSALALTLQDLRRKLKDLRKETHGHKENS
jgi:hypothetical protein